MVIFGIREELTQRHVKQLWRANDAYMPQQTMASLLLKRLLASSAPNHNLTQSFCTTNWTTGNNIIEIRLRINAFSARNSIVICRRPFCVGLNVSRCFVSGATRRVIVENYLYINTGIHIKLLEIDAITKYCVFSVHYLAADNGN